MNEPSEEEATARFPDGDAASCAWMPSGPIVPAEVSVLPVLTDRYTVFTAWLNPGSPSQSRSTRVADVATAWLRNRSWLAEQGTGRDANVAPPFVLAYKRLAVFVTAVAYTVEPNADRPTESPAA